MNLPSATLSAVWYGTGDLRLENRPLPAMGSTDVAVDVVGCGVCATDLHLLDGCIRLYARPKVLGHETGGTVVAVGGAVTHVKPGGAGALETSGPCNTCFFCRGGRTFHCPNRLG